MAALIAFTPARERTTSAARTAAFRRQHRKVAEMLADLTGGELYKLSRPSPIHTTTRPVWRRRVRTGRKTPVPRCWICPMTSTPMMKFTSATPTIAVRCRWRSTPSSSTTTSRARPSTPLHARGQRPFRYRKRHPQGCPWRGGHEGPRHPRQPRGRGEERAYPVG